MYDAVALGELLIDFTTQATDPDGYPTMAAHPGGAPANFLAAIAKFGGKAPEDLSEAELREIVSFACGAARLTTTKHGGISSVPGDMVKCLQV